MLNISGIHHVSIIVADTERALAFYQGLLGLEPDLSRPDLGYAGAWFNIASVQIHLLELPNPDPLTGRPEHGGRDRHLALCVNSIAALEQKLEQEGIPFTMSRSGRRALFCRDPDGNALEFIEN